MCTATELDRSCFDTVTHCYNSYSFTVFLTEQSHSAKLLSFCDRHFFHFYIKSFKDILVYKCFDLELLLCCHCVEVREVKSKSVSVNELTCLMNVFTENFSQCSLKQMCAAMVSHNSITCLSVNSEVSLLTYSYLALFNNRIEFIADAYYKKTDNLLMQASLPTYVSGLIRAPWVNAGAMTNKGVEFTLNTHNIQTRDFTWTSGLTFSINHNEVTKLYSESSAISGINGSETLTYTMVGEPVGQFYGYKVIGMFKEEGDFYKKGADGNFLLDETGNRIQVAIPKDQTIGKSGIWVGDYIYEDRDNNGVIDEKDRTFLGNPAPKFTFGFNNYLSYKGFDLNIFLNGSVGNKAINLIRRTFTDPMRNSNLLKEATGIAQIAMHDPEVGDEVLSNVYVANADAAKVQRITTSSANDNNRISDRFVEDASYLRIKNISLGYTFPQKWLRRLQIDHLRLYVNIQNLCTITGYKGYDPEIGALNYNVLLRGVDDARYPSQRIYTFGLNFNF